MVEAPVVEGVVLPVISVPAVEQKVVQEVVLTPLQLKLKAVVQMGLRAPNVGAAVAAAAAEAEDEEGEGQLHLTM